MGDLEVQGLVKHYGDNLVVNEVSFSVMEGEFFVLLGPSGGGKSTMLRLLCGLETAEAGRIILSGRDITRAPSRERNIGMVFQEYGLYPHMNVFQNIAYGLEARGFPRDEVDKRVRASAEKLGLTPMINRVIVDLSGGEQQRVALARALAKDADLYLFDEPLSNLDPKLRAQARRDILMLHREKHRPSVYVTHDQTEALAIADRIGVIAKGSLQQVGTAEELVEHPANMFVAGFIGTPAMNLIPCDLVCDAGKTLQYRVDADGLNLALPRKWNPVLEHYPHKQIVLGIRPAAITASVGTENVLAGAVTNVEPLIGETIVTVKINDHLILSAVFPDIDEDAFRPGQIVRLGVDAGSLCLFEPKSQKALEAA